MDHVLPEDQPQHQKRHNKACLLYTSLRGYIGAALMLLSLFIMEGDWSFLGRKKRV